MADTIPSTTTQNLSEEEYRQLCKRVRQHQLQKGNGKKKQKPILKPIGNTVSVEKKFVVSQNPCDWDDLTNGTPFALDPNGVLIYTKAGASRALCLNTMSTLPVSGGSCYRIFL